MYIYITSCFRLKVAQYLYVTPTNWLTHTRYPRSTYQYKNLSVQETIKWTAVISYTVEPFSNWNKAWILTRQSQIMHFFQLQFIILSPASTKWKESPSINFLLYVLLQYINIHMYIVTKESIPCIFCTVP